jgi:hypothetical protein
MFVGGVSLLVFCGKCTSRAFRSTPIVLPATTSLKFVMCVPCTRKSYLCFLCHPYDANGVACILCPTFSPKIFSSPLEKQSIISFICLIPIFCIRLHKKRPSKPNLSKNPTRQANHSSLRKKRRRACCSLQQFLSPLSFWRSSNISGVGCSTFFVGTGW